MAIHGTSEYNVRMEEPIRAYVDDVIMFLATADMQVVNLQTIDESKVQ